MRIFMLALMISTLTVHAQQGAPSAPTWFQILNVDNTSLDLGKHHDVSLAWRHGQVNGDHPRASEFVIYRADLTLPNPEQSFVEIATVSAAGDAFSYVDADMKCGEYLYKVAGKLRGVVGESSPQINAIVRGTTCAPGGVDARYLTFTTYPQTVLVKGKPFEYTAQAKHSVPSEQKFIRYKIMSGPDSMMIDSVSGKITWLATNVDYASELIKIRAYHMLNSSESGDQKWWFRFATDADLEVIDPTSVDLDDDDFVDRIAQLTISPNPASEMCQLRFRSTGKAATIEIVSSDGAVVRTMTTETTSGYFTYGLNVSAIPSGAYIIRVRVEGLVQEAPLRIIR